MISAQLNKYPATILNGFSEERAADPIVYGGASERPSDDVLAFARSHRRTDYSDFKYSISATLSDSLRFKFNGSL
jgi:hypothetical protein